MGCGVESGILNFSRCTVRGHPELKSRKWPVMSVRAGEMIHPKRGDIVFTDYISSEVRTVQVHILMHDVQFCFVHSATGVPRIL